MKLSGTRIVLSLLALIGLFASCNSKDQHSISDNDIAFDTISINKIYHLENDSTKPSCSLKIKYIAPIEYVDTIILSQIQKAISTTFFGGNTYNDLNAKDATEKYANNYIDLYKIDAETLFANWDQSDESEDYFSYYKTMESNVIYNKSNLISYQVKSMEYKGGANAYTEYKNIVVNLESGNIISEGDIFVTGYKKVLDELLLLKLKQKNKVESADALFELGYSRIEDFTSNNNFLVDNKGISYIFNQGDYSIPTLGEIRIELTFSELTPILKEESPLSNLIGR